jgi:hypothetical protein
MKVEIKHCAHCGLHHFNYSSKKPDNEPCSCCGHELHHLAPGEVGKMKLRIKIFCPACENEFPARKGVNLKTLVCKCCGYRGEP